MHPGTNHPLLIFGTPLGNWYPLARSILDAAKLNEDDPYESWHRELFGAGAGELEVGVSREASPKLEIPEHLRSRIAGRAGEGGANSESAGVSVFGCWTAEVWLKALPSATCLVFYEHPALMLSRCLAADPTGSPEALLAIWSASARKIVAAVRHHRDRTYLLNVQECLTFGKKFAQWVQQYLQVTLETDGGAGGARPDADPIQAFAQVLCSENSSITKLVQELEVSTHPICDEWNSYNAKAVIPTAAAALTQWLAMRQISADIAAKDREIATYKELARKREEDAAVAAKELLALRQVSVEIAAKDREIEQYRERTLKMEEDAAVAVKELLAVRQKSIEIAAKDREIEQYKDLAVRNHKSALDTYEMLLTELHDAFKESERYFEQWKKAESSGGKLWLKVDSVFRRDTREVSDHRHVNYTFREVNLLGRQWPVVHLRLVQHLGHAGLAILSGDPVRPPLYRWEPSGSENGIPFMLFVPSDATARAALVRATASDLVFIADAVALIHSDLLLHGLSENGRTNWIQVAERLQQEIRELPERLHYDSVRTELRPAVGRGPSFVFDVVNASFRGRVFPSLKFSWGPSFGGGRFSLHLTDRAHPPLSYWPQDDGGRFLDDLDVRGHWDEFTGKDKAIVQLILSEIPNFLVHASNQHPASGIEGKGLRLGARISSNWHPLLWTAFPSRPTSTASRS